jgi:hypothetical protein
MRIYVFLGVLVVVLVGCTTPAQQAAAMEDQAQRIVQVYGPACEKLGYARGSDGWRNCMLRLRGQQNTGYSCWSYNY